MKITGSIRQLLHALRGRPRYKRFFELEKMQYLPRAELREQQFAKLMSLVKHAWRTTDYYRDMFAYLGITPNDIRSFADFAELPVLTREDIQNNLDRLCSSAVSPENRFRNSSGGTTGHPIQFYQDQRVLDAMEANVLLCLSFAGWEPSDMVVSIWGNPKDTLSTALPGYVKPWLSGTAYVNAYRYGADEMTAWLGVIARYRRVFLYGYATVLADLAAFCLEQNKKVPNIAGVITTSEQLYAAHREAITSAFGCKVHDQYGSRETPGVAAECGQGRMHLLTHSVYTEFLPLTYALPADTVAVEEGAPPPMRLVLSDLNNYAMPLLRYEIGDYGSPREGSCPCGRGFPLMHLGVGRIGGTLLQPGGERLYSTMFVRQMYHIPGIRSFQFRQTALDHVRLFVIPSQEFSGESDRKLRELQERFPVNVCPGASLSVHYVEELPRTTGGKHRQVVCEVGE